MLMSIAHLNEFQRLLEKDHTRLLGVTSIASSAAYLMMLMVSALKVGSLSKDNHRAYLWTEVCYNIISLFIVMILMNTLALVRDDPLFGCKKIEYCNGLHAQISA